jgi:hypothetical protein
MKTKSIGIAYQFWQNSKICSRKSITFFRIGNFTENVGIVFKKKFIDFYECLMVLFKTIGFGSPYLCDILELKEAIKRSRYARVLTYGELCTKLKLTIKLKHFIEYSN